MRGGKRKGAGAPRKPLSQKKRAVLVTLSPDLLDGLAVLPGSRSGLIEQACRKQYDIQTKEEQKMIPASIPKKYKNRIAHWDDERNIGNSLIVSLKDGWRDGTDLAICHTLAEDTVSDMLYKLMATQPCDCPDCKQ